MQVGIVMPMGEDPEQGTTVHYPEIRERALQAEAAGFDSIWVYDHLIFRFPERPVSGIWEVWTLLSALADATQRVSLGTLVLCTAFRNPAVLAKMATTLDDISAGRLILGLGAGWHQPEFDAFGIPFDHRVDRFEEALEIIAPLLREGHVDFRGKYYGAPDCDLRPRGPSAGGPPILIASSGQRMLRLTARFGDLWNTAWLGRPDPLAERRASLDAACHEVGRDPATLGVTVGVGVAYGSGDEEQQAIKAGKALGGSPEEVAQGLLAYERLGVAHVICSLSDVSQASVDWLAEALKHFREGR
jgi:probable F420-dependent oxidoreductase